MPWIVSRGRSRGPRVSSPCSRHCLTPGRPRNCARGSSGRCRPCLFGLNAYAATSWHPLRGTAHRAQWEPQEALIFGVWPELRGQPRHWWKLYGPLHEPAGGVLAVRSRFSLLQGGGVGSRRVANRGYIVPHRATCIHYLHLWYIAGTPSPRTRNH
jgi:hypothetical protein